MLSRSSKNRRAVLFTLLLAAPAIFVVGEVAVGEALAAPKKEKPAFDTIPKSTPPDPTPLVSSRQWVFDLEYRAGDVQLLSVSEKTLKAPVESARAIGRFALELYEGPTLIERVRFDFPLLIEAEDAGPKRPPSVTRHLTSRIGVLFPATPRGTRLELWDRGTDRRWNLPWPPGSSVDGGRDALP